MRKLLLLLLCIALSIMCSSCKTIDDDDTRPILNNDSFTNYIPWWVSNDVAYGSSNEYTQKIKIQKN